jgi:hypothetical protein
LKWPTRVRVDAVFSPEQLNFENSIKSKKAVTLYQKA